MATFYSPDGNPEVWEAKPVGYYTEQEWFAGPAIALAAEQRKQEIGQRLDQLDLKSIRPLRAMSGGTATEDDRERLAGYETEAAELRAELSALMGHA